MAGDSSGAASALSMLLRLRDQAELSQVVFCRNRLKFMILFDFDVFNMLDIPLKKEIVIQNVTQNCHYFGDGLSPSGNILHLF